MRLVTFRHDGADSLGALLDDQVVHLPRAWASYLQSHGVTSPYQMVEAALAGDMLRFLSAGRRALEAARQAQDFVRERLSAGEAPTGPRGERLLMPVGEVALLAPIPRPGKLLCIGLNYRDHAEEVRMKPPERPILFAKYSTSVIGPGAPIVLPPFDERVDYEAELGVVIGKVAKGVSEDEAMDCVAGYTLVNDVSGREAQMGDGQWVRGKSFDTFAPMGPTLVTRDEIQDPHNLNISLRLNGQTMQSSNTRNLIFGIPQLISFLARGMTLEPGDVIASGTPGGVGMSRKPPVYLKPGDVVQVEVEKVGILENGVIAG